MLDIGSQKIKSQGIKENDYVTNLQYIKFFHILGFQLRVRLVVVKRFPENTYFPEMLISGNFRKRKMFSAVWLSRKLFSGKSFPVFGLWINFTENMICVTN